VNHELQQLTHFRLEAVGLLIRALVRGLLYGCHAALPYLEKLAYGRFSDINFVDASKKRGFCWLRPGAVRRGR
jgi:hypothetical protein